MKDASDAVSTIRRLASEGAYTIVNETVDVMDGGVTGVTVEAVIEFSPQDTPRCVEKPGTCLFSSVTGLKVLERVYGFRPALDYFPEVRVEFRLYPLHCGVRNEHTIVWEIENVGATVPQSEVVWPNRFSRFLGDKAFGLMTADALGLPVPRTTVISRSIAPFTFGRTTRTSESWIRTCPATPEPGRFTTRQGWIDPFQLLNEEDPGGDGLGDQHPHRIASILSQESVDAAYSGALISLEDSTGIVDGVVGYGDS